MVADTFLAIAFVIFLVLVILGIVAAIDVRLPAKPVRNDPKQDEPTNTSMSESDRKYLGAIMVDKNFHGDKNWNKPWEL
jgi:hypothetical protein